MHVIVIKLKYISHKIKHPDIVNWSEVVEDKVNYK